MRRIFDRLLGEARAQTSGEHATQAELYNDLGVAVAETVGRNGASILLYVEMKEDTFSTCVRYSSDDSPHYKGAFSNDLLREALMKLQSYLLDQSPDKHWTAMEYFIENGEIDVSLSYAVIDDKIPIWERTPAITEKYFPGKTFSES